MAFLLLIYLGMKRDLLTLSRRQAVSAILRHSRPRVRLLARELTTTLQRILSFS